MNMKKVCLAILLSLLSLGLRAEIILPGIFSDNMVIQQNTKVKIWGRANAFTRLSATCSWDSRTYSAKADSEGFWEMYIETPSAGGPYRIYFSNMTGGDKLTLNNVYIGEVWVCSGQSNMVHPVRGYKNQPVNGTEEALKDAHNYRDIHFFEVGKDTSSVRQFDCEGEWVDGSAENIADISATAYFFGKELRKALNVPVGIIVSSWGSSRIEAWMSPEAIKTAGGVDVDVLNQETKIQKRPSLAYNSMIAPIEGYTAKGFVWFQLGANRKDYKNYPAVLTELVKSWRTAWGASDMTFINIQSCMYPWDGSKDKISIQLIAEKQFEVRKVIPDYYVATSSDLMSPEEPHHPQKWENGYRVMLLAMKYAYGHNDVKADAPDFESVNFRKGKAEVIFNNVGTGLVCKGGKVLAFELSGADKNFYPAEAEIVDYNKVVVSCPEVKVPVALRYAFRNYCEVSLYNDAGLTPRIYRTDSWDDIY